jgi:hypothetical protein
MITRYSELHLKDAEASDDSGEWIIVGVKLEDFERKFVMLRANENGRSGELDVANPGSLRSEYRVESAADPNTGRGTTIRNLHRSEVARW